MENSIPSFSDLLEKIPEDEFKTWLDRLSFISISLLWFAIATLFGVAYYQFRSSSSYLMNNVTGAPAEQLLDHIYFSFITATTTGFGDLIPMGLFKVVAIFEVVMTLVIFAVLTSKIISLKQNMIIEEIYDISFNEKINRLRSSLLLFRQHVGSFVAKIESGAVRKKETDDLYIQLSSFEDNLNEIRNMLHKPTKGHYTKIIDAVNAELIFNGITHSMERMHELMHQLNKHRVEWKRPITSSVIKRCTSLNHTLFDELYQTKILPDGTMLELLNRNRKVIAAIEEKLDKMIPQER